MTAERITATLGKSYELNLFAGQEAAAQKSGELNHIGNKVLPIVQATALFWTVLPLLRAGLQAAGQPLLSSRVRWGIISAPAVLFLAVEILPKGNIQKGLHGVQKHLGHACQIATAVSQIAIYYFTGSSLALVFVGLQVVDALQRNQILSPRISLVYEEIKLLVFVVSSVASGGIWNVAVGIGSLVFSPTLQGKILALSLGKKYIQLSIEYSLSPSSKIANQRDQVGLRLFKALQLVPTEKTLDDPEEEHAPPPSAPVRILDVAEITPTTQFAVNLTHLTQEPLPPIPNVDPQELLTLWDRVQGQENALQREGLQTLVEVMKQNNPRDNVYTHYLQLVTEKLPGQDKEKQIQILQKLAQTPEQTEIGEAFAELMGHRNGLPLRMKILHRLQALRTRQFFRERRYRSWQLRCEMWLARRGFLSVSMPGLTLGGLHAQTNGQTPANSQQLKLIGYTLDAMQACVTAEDVNLWLQNQPPRVQTALDNHPHAKLYMLVQLGILDIQRGNS